MGDCQQQKKHKYKDLFATEDDFNKYRAPSFIELAKVLKD